MATDFRTSIAHVGVWVFPVGQLILQVCFVLCATIIPRKSGLKYFFLMVNIFFPVSCAAILQSLEGHESLINSVYDDFKLFLLLT